MDKYEQVIMRRKHPPKVPELELKPTHTPFDTAFEQICRECEEYFHEEDYGSYLGMWHSLRCMDEHNLLSDTQKRRMKALRDLAQTIP